ncbi:MAG: cell division protein FtsZ [Mycoplasma sp.]
MENNKTKLQLGLLDDNVDSNKMVDFSDIKITDIETNIETTENKNLITEFTSKTFTNNFNDSYEESVDDLDDQELFDNLGDFNFEKELKIKVFGIGGAGNNMVKHIANSTSINKSWLYAVNTDYQVLKMMPSGLNLILIGKKITKGLGSGSDPEVGRDAAYEDVEIIKKQLKDTDLLFIVSGMGKGTGTGASPVIAEIAKEMGILTISLVNLPSISNEGKMIYEKGYNGLNQLRDHAAGLLTISNEKLFRDTKGDMAIWESFLYANRVIANVINEIINLVTIPSEINVDFNDMKNFFSKQTEFQVNSFSFNNDEDIKNKIMEKLSNEIFQDTLNGANKVIINYKLNPCVTNQFINNIRTALEDITGNKDLEVTYAVAYDTSIEYAELSIIVATNNISDKAQYMTSESSIGETSSLGYHSNLNLDAGSLTSGEEPFEDYEEFRAFKNEIESKSVPSNPEENESITPTKLNKIISRTMQFNGNFIRKEK